MIREGSGLAPAVAPGRTDALRQSAPGRLLARIGRNERTVFFAQGAAILAVIVGFTGGWARGDLVLDGPGLSIYIQLSLDRLRNGHAVPYWVPDLWSGSPVWSLVPSAAV